MRLLPAGPLQQVLEGEESVEETNGLLRGRDVLKDRRDGISSQPLPVAVSCVATEEGRPGLALPTRGCTHNGGRSPLLYVAGRCPDRVFDLRAESRSSSSQAGG